MATTEDLIARREALERALASGVRQVSYGDRTIAYRSMAEIERALDRLNAEIGDRPRVSRIVVSSTKGL